MTGVAIVAVPSKSDIVWRVSSEKIPHMTILYLGDALDKKDYQHVQEFVTHVADTMLNRFGMGVDKRGVLGADEADVLFFKNKDNSDISLFRSYLLQDTIIREAYESIEQFDGWTPHLTLGYPETPAKKDPREISEFYWVGFDRLMIWTGEFEGPEIELKDEDMAVAMDGLLEETEEFLSHFGVKGMKWGVRKQAFTKGVYGKPVGPARVGVRLGGDKRPSAIDKLSDKYNRTDLGKVTNAITRVLASGPFTALQTTQLVALTGLTAASAGAGAPLTALASGAVLTQAAATHGLVAVWANKDNVRRINNNPKYKAKNLKADKKLRKEYHDEQMQSLGRALWDPRGVRLAETRARVSGEPGDKSVVVRPYAFIQHSIEDLSLTIDVVYSDTGHIVEFVPRVPDEIAKEFYRIVNSNEDLTQSDLNEVDDFLEHHGVKGMRWGVRKAERGTSGANKVGGGGEPKVKGPRKSLADRRHERTVKVQEKAAASIARSQELQARAEAKTAATDAKAAASTAKLEAKVAKKEAKLAKTEARIGVDDPSNSYVRPSSGIAGKTDAESVRLRADAAKSARTLDDATLKAYTQRIDTEKKLKQAIAEDAAPGRTAAKKLMGEAGKDLAKKALVGAGSMAVFYGLSRMSKTHAFKVNPEGVANLLSGKGKTSGSDAFEKVDKMAELAGGMKIPMSEVMKWKKPSSMGPKATPF